jgi:hypothetical protein
MGAIIIVQLKFLPCSLDLDVPADPFKYRRGSVMLKILLNNHQNVFFKQLPDMVVLQVELLKVVVNLLCSSHKSSDLSRNIIARNNPCCPTIPQKVRRLRVFAKMIGLQDYEIDLLLVPHPVRCPPLPNGFRFGFYQAFQLLSLLRARLGLDRRRQG